MLSSFSLTNDLDELVLTDVEIFWDTIVVFVVAVIVFVVVCVVVVVLISIYDNNYIISFLLTLNDQCSHHIETSHLICSANQQTGFYMMRRLIVKRLTNDNIYNVKTLAKSSEM